MPSIQRSVFEKSFSQEWEKFSELQSIEKQVQLFRSPAFFYENYPTEFEVPWLDRGLTGGILLPTSGSIPKKESRRGRFLASLSVDKTTPFCFSKSRSFGGNQKPQKESAYSTRLLRFVNLPVHVQKGRTISGQVSITLVDLEVISLMKAGLAFVRTKVHPPLPGEVPIWISEARHHLGRDDAGLC